MIVNDITAALGLLQSGHRVFVHGAAATPHVLIQEMLVQKGRLRNVTLIHLHTEGECLYSAGALRAHFHVINFFVGQNIRSKLNYDSVDYLPCFLSEIPELFRSGVCPLDVALIHVSPPDRFGYCSLGVSVDIAKSACEHAKIIIAQVNPRMPRCLGDGLIHKGRFAAMIDVNHELPVPLQVARGVTEEVIAKKVAELIEDGSTLQMGIGAIPDAVTRILGSHRDLGIHTEMCSDGVLDLIEKGAVTNSLKNVHRGKSVSTFLLGSKRLYDFSNDNPAFIQLGSDYVNNPYNIARNPKVVAINSAVEVDLTGQICADSVGRKILSGVGGQMDFMRGAALSKEGKPIIALGSLAKDGSSKIVCCLKRGAGVVTTRAHVHYVVTEFGSVNLYGMTLGKRARALISIAHPSHREKLETDFFNTFTKV